jgi:nucleotidyltransferase/DNA polymerase involved in DNA repair
MGTRQGPIGHLDADCFYVSAERVRLLDLADIPVAVLGNQGACVIAKSYEMKAAGVKTGIPIWDALRLCPEAAYVKRDFRWYEVLSRAMLAAMRDLSTAVEYYSIDEFFFDATPPRGLDPGQYAAKIRDVILERVGVPVTVGIARTRSLAKLISDTAKPFGARAVLGRAEEEELLARLAVTEVTGIAGRRQRRLDPWGIRTCLDFARADRRLIRELLTAAGEALWWELLGEPVLPLHPERPRHKVLSRGGSFGESTDRPSVIWAWAVRNVERLVEELEFHEIRAGRVQAWLGYRDGRAGEGHASLETPTDRFDRLLDAIRPCIRRAWIPRAVAQRMHLFATGLVPRSPVQLGLFDVRSERAEAIAAVKRAVNARHGRFALRSAATLPLVGVYRDKSNEWDICDVHGKMCF